MSTSHRCLGLHALIGALGTLAALLCMAGTALADTATISFTDATGKSDPVAGVGRTVQLSGNTAVSKYVFVRWRAVGGAPCAPSASSDSGSVYLDGSWNGDTFNNSTVNGDFSLKKTGAWGTAGTYMFCIWLSSSESTSTTPITQNVTFRGATGTISATVVPISPQTGQEATVTIMGASEAPARVYAAVRPAGGAPCAASYSADSGRSLVNGTNVNGAFVVQATTTQSTGGDYLVCVWLADSSSSAAIAGPQPAVFTVFTPPPPCIVPQIARGTTLDSAMSSLSDAHCVVGKQRYAASRTYARGTIIKFSPVAGTSLAPQAPVDLTISSGVPCRVPTVRRGMRLGAARARIAAAGCTVGSVRYVKSRTRKRGIILRFAPGSGTRLSSQARVSIVVSRGPGPRRH
jgi:hypothetical protein